MFQEEEYQKIIHEIKNSVCIIGSSLQLIQKQHPEVSNFRYWDSTMSDISQLNVLFTDIAYARLFDHMHPAPVHSKTFLESIESYAASFIPEHISYSFCMDNALPYVNIDTNGMQHALINLIKNAVEAIENTGHIEIRAFAENDFLILQIHDSGCGISDEIMNSLYTPKHSSKKNGSGLGLAITKQIITAHHGIICCNSSPNCGTTFTIQLPVTDCN